MRDLGVLLALLLLTGCAGQTGPPTITFEAEGFLRAYLADRDEVIRQTAPGVKRCRTVTPESPVDLRTRCVDLATVQAEWQRRDAIVYSAILSGQTVRGIDWEKAAEIAGKFVNAAAGVL